MRVLIQPDLVLCLKRRGLSKDLKKIAGKNDFSPETKRMNYWKKPK